MLGRDAEHLGQRLSILARKLRARIAIDRAIIRLYDDGIQRLHRRMRQKRKFELGRERCHAIGGKGLIDIAALGGLQSLGGEELAIAAKDFRARAPLRLAQVPLHIHRIATLERRESALAKDGDTLRDLPDRNHAGNFQRRAVVE